MSGAGNIVNNGGFENGLTGWPLNWGGTRRVLHNPCEKSRALSLSGQGPIAQAVTTSAGGDGSRPPAW